MAAASKTERASGPKLAEQVLEKAERPVHIKLIAERVLAQDRRLPKAQRRYQGKTPEQTISAAMTVSSNDGGAFVKTQPGVFALRAWPAAKRNKSPELPEATRSTRQANGGKGSKGSSSKGSSSGGEASAPRKRNRKTKAEKDAVLAEAQQEQAPPAEPETAAA